MIEKNNVQLSDYTVSQDMCVRGGQLRVTQSILILVFLDFNILDFVTSIILTNASSLHFLGFYKP